MSCARQAGRLARLARRLGITGLSSLTGSLAAVTPPVSFVKPGLGGSDKEVLGQARGRRTRSKKKGLNPAGPGFQSRREGQPQPGAQASIFRRPETAAGARKKAPVQGERRPARRPIELAVDFSPAELQILAVQLHLGEAAAAWQIGQLTRQVWRGPGHSDPRPLDWARSDQRQYRFLLGQVAQVRRGRGSFETAALSATDLIELWEFTRFEADRALRNIDHLQAGLSHLKGPTAEYLTGRHQLEARFYTYLAAELEAMIPPARLEAIKAWD